MEGREGESGGREGGGGGVSSGARTSSSSQASRESAFVMAQALLALAAARPWSPRSV